jgi:nucleoside-diphosphate-sugar epimerase
MTKNILILGSSGQIGTELALYLKKKYPKSNIIASDIKEGILELMENTTFEYLDATNAEKIAAVIAKHQIDEIYVMAAMLSAVAEKIPMKAWDLNMTILLNILNIAKDKPNLKIFWPSSIAVFGKTTPKIAKQYTITEPNTVYGISKLSGERWCEYFKNNYAVDIRTIRYPGIISWKVEAGGGTTDYAVDIYYKALAENQYTCFLSKDTKLPMMYMEDALKATTAIMEHASFEKYIPYNVAAMSFTPEELAETIKKQIPDFTIAYKPDERQAIADTWPNEFVDDYARRDWQWHHDFDMVKMTQEMLENLAKKEGV